VDGVSVDGLMGDEGNETHCVAEWLGSRCAGSRLFACSLVRLFSRPIAFLGGLEHLEVLCMQQLWEDVEFAPKALCTLPAEKQGRVPSKQLVVTPV
jgi:hypothetical protein